MSAAINQDASAQPTSRFKGLGAKPEMIADPNLGAILLDIEGTSTPIEFVYEVLFPFARRHVRAFIQEHHDSADEHALFSALSAEHHADRLSSIPSNIKSGQRPPPWDEDSADFELESITQYVHWLMDQDRKSTALKALQGQIWKGGYLSGELVSQVYPDVLPAFRRWQSQGRAIHIFSSGSILAQKLLFAHTAEGDLTGFISGYFDTTTGAKAHQGSYRSIAEKIRRPTGEILFVSDVSAELDAAHQAGMKTALCVRPGNAEVESMAHPVVNTFDVVFP